MQENYKIEKAESSDHIRIVGLLHLTHLPTEGIETHFDNFLVIRHPAPHKERNDLIGTAGLEIYGDAALLRSLAVHPDYQHIGLGTKLINKMIKTAKAKGITRLFLLTDLASDYFRRKGFFDVSRDVVPWDMKQSIEFTTLCASSPTMMLEL